MAGRFVMLAVLENLTLTNALLLGGLIVVGLTKLADYRGWTRSPALVRQENADLRERNATLAAEVERLSVSDREKGERIAALEQQVNDLKKQDQAAVLEAIALHDRAVMDLASETRHQADSRHTEALAVWREIRDNLKGG